jgi:hypothetical protein
MCLTARGTLFPTLYYYTCNGEHPIQKGLTTLKELKVKQTLIYTLQIFKHVLEHPVNRLADLRTLNMHAGIVKRT